MASLIQLIIPRVSRQFPSLLVLIWTICEWRALYSLSASSVYRSWLVLTSTVIQLIPHPCLQSYYMRKGGEMKSCGMSNSLCHLVKMIIWTCPVKNSHTEEVDQDQIINPRLVHPPKPLHSDHISPKMIIKEKVWEHVLLPSILIDHCISSADHTEETVLGYL